MAWKEERREKCGESTLSDSNRRHRSTCIQFASRKCPHLGPDEILFPPRAQSASTHHVRAAYHTCRLGTARQRDSAPPRRSGRLACSAHARRAVFYPAPAGPSTNTAFLVTAVVHACRPRGYCGSAPGDLSIDARAAPTRARSSTRSSTSPPQTVRDRYVERGYTDPSLDTRSVRPLRRQGAIRPVVHARRAGQRADTDKTTRSACPCTLSRHPQ
ncbi:hypothetical protein DFH06DRAFT_1212766 [Mycena polygramma]|nr:hypothetical protein DFH06DRAFT_1212766 [Mycena polygramma]